MVCGQDVKPGTWSSCITDDGAQWPTGGYNESFRHNQCLLFGAPVQGAMWPVGTLASFGACNMSRLNETVFSTGDNRFYTTHPPVVECSRSPVNFSEWQLLRQEGGSSVEARLPSPAETVEMASTVLRGPIKSDDDQLWAGTLSFDDANLSTVDVPLNVTVSEKTAMVEWYFTRDGPMVCRRQLEPSLDYSLSQGVALFHGCGEMPCSGSANFYTFQGRLSSDGTIRGQIYHPPYPSTQKVVGNFSISEKNKQLPPQCKAHGPPPSPPPPGPPIAPKRPNPTALWPAPALYQAGPSGGVAAVIDAAALALRCVSPDASQVCAGIIAPAFARGKGWAFPVSSADASGATLTTVAVHVGASVPLQLGVNESYTLHVNSTSAVITAETAWGAMWGLESFFQLVMREPPEACSRCTTAPCRATCGKYIVREHVPLSIVDRPRTRWRGLMIDVSAAVPLRLAFR